MNITTAFRLGACALAAALLTEAASPACPPLGGNPRIITTPQELDAVRNDLGVFYQLGNDIDLSGYPMAPIGTQAAPFTGTFDGAGYAIRNFEYDGVAEQQPDHVGLFGFVDGGKIRCVRLQDYDVRGSLRVGGLVGTLLNGVVDSCTVKGVVRGTRNVGGMVGFANSSDIFDCGGEVEVEGVWEPLFIAPRWTGGLIGHVDPGCLVRGCRSSGTVTGFEQVGGLAGVLHGSIMKGCASDVYVEGDQWIGGLIGYLQDEPPFETSVWDCAAYGDVFSPWCLSDVQIPQPWTGGAGTGGLVGYMESDTKIVGSFATGDVECGASPFLGGTGGLVGWADPECMILESYATGDVTAVNGGTGGLIGWMSVDGLLADSYASGTVIGKEQVGGLSGWQDSDVENCYYDGPLVHGTWSVGGLLGYISHDSPILVKRSYAIGGVVEATGNGSVSAVGGLAGYVFPGTMISKCHATMDVYSTDREAGGLVGQLLLAHIDKSYATGNVYTEHQQAGGLVGRMRAEVTQVPQGLTGTIKDSYAHGSVLYIGTGGPSFEGQVGGLIGRMESNTSQQHSNEVHRCYSVGEVDQQRSTAGGLIGIRAGSLGMMPVIDSYWDTQTSGQSQSAGGTGKTTAEMMDQNTFVNWNFTTVWGIDGGYPFLLWQLD